MAYRKLIRPSLSAHPRREVSPRIERPESARPEPRRPHGPLSPEAERWLDWMSREARIAFELIGGGSIEGNVIWYDRRCVALDIGTGGTRIVQKAAIVLYREVGHDGARGLGAG